MKNATDIFRFLLDAASRGERTAVVTVTGVAGGSPRSPGAHMAVSETGAYLGSLSGGCIEAAIATEARRAIAAGRMVQMRFGQGSPFIDIQLPCGGGIDLLICPTPDSAGLRHACDLLAAREPIALRLGPDGSLSARAAQPAERTRWDADVYVVRHDPDMRLIIAGRGAETLALARLGRCFGSEVVVLTPEHTTIEAAASLGAEAWELVFRQRSRHLNADRYTALVLLFHDHDWELELLVQALEQEAFFVGAMGSRATHLRRLRALAQCGVSEAAAARLVGPIGLIKQARDPETLAISVIAQIVQLYTERVALPQPAITPAYAEPAYAEPWRQITQSDEAKQAGFE